MDKDIKMPKNLGFLPPPSLKDEPRQFLGGALSVQITRPLGDWFNVKITGETQSFKLFDGMTCTSGAWTNSEEKQIENFRENGVRIDGIDYVINEDKIKDWLDENGKVNLSERFLAKVSGTTEKGNDPMTVLDARDDYGLPPESMWPLKPFIENGFNWSEYYKTIPQAVKDKAKIWNTYFKTRYERITDTSKENFRFVLKQCPIYWASPTCSGWMTSPIVASCSMTPNHMTICEGLEWLKYMWDYDTYDPFDKKLTWNYPIYYPYKAIVIPQMEVLKRKIPYKKKEITTEMVRLVWLKRPDLQKEFPAENKFYSVKTPNYTRYDWAQKYLYDEHPEIVNMTKISWWDLFIAKVVNWLGLNR